MSEQNGPPPNPEPAGSGGLQFERAEFADRPAAKCSACAGGIQDAYFTVNGNVVCATCRERVAAQATGGSGIQRFAKAALLGGIAAAMGCGIYYAILALSGYELGLIAILVGWMVGKAVSNGSGRRGGWVYQLLAVFLTYTAIVTSYIPLLMREYNKTRAQRAAATVTVGDAQTPAAGTAPSGAPATKTGESKPPAEKVPAPKAAGGKVEELPDDQQAGEDAGATLDELGGVGYIIVGIVLVIVAFALPFLAGSQNILGLIIIGIGLYEAWALNRRVVLDVKGPFPVAPPAPPEASPASV